RTDLDIVARQHAQVRCLLVLRGLVADEAHLDVERERPEGAGVGAIFAAGEGADLSHGDLLDCWLDSRPSRALTAICQRRDGRPAAFRPAAQRRMVGRAILLLREEWAKPRGRRSRASHCGARPGSAATASWREIRQSKARLDAWTIGSLPRRAPAQMPHAAMRRHPA